jgi:uncharacterized protein
VSVWHRWEAGDLWLHLRVQPRASRDEFVGVFDDQLRVRITAPPVEGQANAHLVRFVARQFGVSPSQVRVEAGASSRCKWLRVCEPKTLPDSLPALSARP